MLPGTSTLGTLAMELPPVDRTNLCCQRGSCNWSSCQSFLCLNFASGLKEKFYQRLKEGSELVPRGKAPRGTSTASQRSKSSHASGCASPVPSPSSAPPAKSPPELGKAEDDGKDEAGSKDFFSRKSGSPPCARGRKGLADAGT